MRNLGIYIRKSKETENQKSLKEQRLLGIEFAKENNFNPQFYDDGIVSGADDGDVEKRPEYSRMLTDIANGKLYAIFIWNTDRTARDEISWQTLANLLKKHNVYLYDNGTKADFSDENTLLFYSIKSSMDAYFSRVTSTKIKSVLKRNANENKFNGIPKYGFTNDANGKLIVDENEAKIIKLIFDMYLNGNGYASIASHLNDEDIPTRYNKIGGNHQINTNPHDTKANHITKEKSSSKWYPRTVQRIINSRNYIGEKVYQNKMYEIPKIISLKTFNDAQERLASKRNKSGKRTSMKYLLNKLVMCGKCGKHFTGRRINGNDYYRCASRIVKGRSCKSRGIRMEELDKLIWGFISKDKKYIAMLDRVAQPKETQADIANEIKKLKNSLKAKKLEINNVTKYLIKGTITEDEANPQLNRIRTEINDVRLKLERKDEVLRSLETSKETIEDVKNEILNIDDSTIAFDIKQELIRKHIDLVKVSSDNVDFRIEVYLKFLDDTIRIVKRLEFPNFKQDPKILLNK